jgi:hypothetical protein
MCGAKALYARAGYVGGRNAAEIGEQVHREVLQPTVFNARAVRRPFVEAVAK